MIYLSYTLSEETPLYGNGEGISFEPDKIMENGDSCNTMKLSFPNHSGTHIDLPYHFNTNGKTLNHYPASFWLFNKVEIIDLSGRVDDCQIIGPEYFTDLKDSECDILIIKTGYCTFRGTDRYTLTPPGLSSELAPLLRKKFPMLRCLGIDLISVSSFSNREEGRKAHNTFLHPYEGNPILLIEDMKLDDVGPFSKIIVSPLQIDKADGVPCTIFGFKA